MRACPDDEARAMRISGGTSLADAQRRRCEGMRFPSASVAALLTMNAETFLFMPMRMLPQAPARPCLPVNRNSECRGFQRANRMNELRLKELF